MESLGLVFLGIGVFAPVSEEPRRRENLEKAQKVKPYGVAVTSGTFFEKSLGMKAVTLFIILIAGFALSNMEEVYAMNVDKNLPMGNAEDIKIERDKVHFAAEKHGSPWSMWFGFRINGAKGKKITCIWERTNEVLAGGSLGAAVPVYRAFENKPFKRIQASACEYQPEHNRFAVCSAQIRGEKAPSLLPTMPPAGRPSVAP